MAEPVITVREVTRFAVSIDLKTFMFDVWRDVGTTDQNFTAMGKIGVLASGCGDDQKVVEVIEENVRFLLDDIEKQGEDVDAYLYSLWAKEYE